MENIKIIGAANEIQKLYSRYGMVVPVGDLETGKAPAVTPLPATSTQTSITFQFNIASGADIDRISYKVNDSKDAVIVDHPSKGVLTIELDKLEYNSGPYEIELTVENENGDTKVTTSADLQHYTNWAVASEVLAGNRFIGEDGTEAVGNIPTKDEDDITSTKGHMTVPAGYYAENIVLNVPDPTYGTETFTSNATYNASTYGYDGFSSVTVAVPAPTPTTGGAVVDTAEIDDSDGVNLRVSFDTLPTLDTDNHRYNAIVTWTDGDFAVVLSDDPNWLYFADEFTAFGADLTNKIGEDPTILPHEYDEQLDKEVYISPFSASLYIYEDDLAHLKYIIPISVTNPLTYPNEEE